MQTQNLPTEELQNIVGAQNVREATAEDTIEGAEPSLVVEPGTIEETSEVLKLASREGLTVSPRGGGTKMGLGNPPRQVDLILSTLRMDEIIEHVPGDQIVRSPDLWGPSASSPRPTSGSTRSGSLPGPFS
jgi:glycolate oxidase FAD binding subunit